MSRQLVRQPSGLFAVWSTIVDNFLVVNCTKEELIQYYKEEHVKEFERSVLPQLEKRLQQIDEHGKVPIDGYPDWEGSLVWIKFQHGEKEFKKSIEYFDSEELKCVDDPNSKFNQKLKQYEAERESDERMFEEKRKRDEANKNKS